MTVAELIELLKLAPPEMEVAMPVSDYDGYTINGYGVDIHGIIVVDAVEDGDVIDGPVEKALMLCRGEWGRDDQSDACPPGIKTFCQRCDYGCRTIWLVIKDGKPTWIENDEIRGYHEPKNRYEFVNDADPFGLRHTSIKADAPLPEYPWMPT